MTVCLEQQNVMTVFYMFEYILVYIELVEIGIEIKKIQMKYLSS